MSPTIRPAVPDDVPALCPLFELLDEMHRLERPDLFQVPDGPRRDPADVLAWIAGPDSTVLVADGGGDGLLGLATLFTRTVQAGGVKRARRFVELDNLVVHPGARRRGIARRLLDASRAWAQAQGVGTLEVSVWTFNRDAVAFYQAAGFAPQVLRLSRSV